MSIKSTPDYYRPNVFVTGDNSSHTPPVPSVGTLNWTNMRIAQTGPSNWRYLIRNNLDATTSLYGTRFAVLRGSGYWEAIHKYPPEIGGYWVKTVGDVIGGYLDLHGTSGVNDEAVNAALRKFHDKINESRKAFESGVALGEFLEAVRFVRNPLKSLQNESWKFVGRLGRLKKVYRRNPKDYYKAMTDTYLAYKFAAVPLASDISSAAVAFDNIREGRREKVKFTASGESVSNGTGFLQSSYGLVSGYFNPVQFYVDTIDSCTVTFRGGMIATEIGTVPPMSELGLTFGDIVPTLWELIPFSFVVDYIANVDDILQSLKTLALEFTYLNRTVRNGRRVQLSDMLPPAQDPAQFSSLIAWGGQANSLATNVSRERINATDLIPNLQFKLPGRWQALNTLALAAGFARTNPKR